MFNSATNKTPNNNTFEKSAFFDFNRQGFSPLLGKSRLPLNDQEIKENNPYQNEFFVNKVFLKNSLIKDKLQIDSISKMNSPFNLNFFDRRNILTQQGVLYPKKIFSSEKILANFNTNSNLIPKNFDKNYLFDSNLERNKDSKYMFSNALTGSNSNIFKIYKINSNQKKNEIKYADDYSFKKNNLTPQIDNLKQDKEGKDDEQKDENEIKEVYANKFYLRRNSRFDGNDKVIGSLSKFKSNNSIAIENKKLKKLGKSKIIKQKKNNNKIIYTNEIDNIINYKDKHQRKPLSALSNCKLLWNKKEEIISTDNEIKGFSFLKQKRKTKITSSLFGNLSQSNSRNLINSSENNNTKASEIIKKTEYKKAVDKDITISFCSEYSSESEYISTRELCKFKTKRESKTNKQIAINIIEKKNIKCLRKNQFKNENDFESNTSKPLVRKEIKAIKKIPFNVSKSSNKFEELENTSPAFSFGKEIIDNMKENESEEDNDFRDIIDFKDSIENMVMKKNGFSIENFDEIFGRKKFFLNIRKKPKNIKNLISFVDSKVSNIISFLPNKTKNISLISVKNSNIPNEYVKSNLKENINSSNNSLNNKNRNLECTNFTKINLKIF
jgi:hypothetical protein